MLTDHAKRGPVLEVKGVRKSYTAPGSGAEFTVLDIPSLTVHGGEAVALAGPSGSGKTTLLHIISGLLKPTQGSVTVNGTAVWALSESERDRFRANTIGYVFQSFNLLPAFSALENVLLAMSLAGVVPNRERKARAEALLKEMGLSGRLRHRPSQLSVGEQQRVAVARALANQPSILLADEPTASVDPETREVVFNRLLEETARRDCVLLVSTHDQGLLPRFARVISLARRTTPPPTQSMERPHAGTARRSA